MIKFIFRSMLPAFLILSSGYPLSLAVETPRDKASEIIDDLFPSYMLLEEGKYLYKKGDYSAAREKLLRSLTLFPDNDKSAKYLKLCDKKLKRKTKKGNFKVIMDQKTHSMYAGTHPSRADTAPVSEAPQLKTVINPVGQEAPPSADKKKISAEYKNTEHLDHEKPIAEQKKRKSDEKAVKKISTSEHLLKMGDTYYKKGHFSKAYDVYKQAHKTLE